MTPALFDDRCCDLGEGPLWHPMRAELFWFDITAGRLLSRGAQGAREWRFDQMVSAAGWISADELLIASEAALFRFHLGTGAQHHVADLEAEQPDTRSNDGRADPMGGFWIGTMGKDPDTAPGAGAIYRWYRGTLRRVFGGLTIPNAICFSPDGRLGHFTDTATGQVMRVSLDAQGWPQKEPEVFLDLRAQGLHPDGAVIDRDGVLWLAQWGAGRVAAYGPEGRFLRAVTFDAPHTSCPAFGGADGRTLFCTTALQGMDAEARARHPLAGATFALADVAPGQLEPQVIL